MRRTLDLTLAVACAVSLAIAGSARVAHAQQAARIDTVNPTHADPGRVVTITGIGFGARNVRITGATAFLFFLQGTDWVDGVSSAQGVTITATATGFSAGATTANDVRPVLDIVNLPSATTALSSNIDFVVRVGVPTVQNTMQSLEPRRFGAPPLVVTATNSNAGIAELDQNGGLNGAQLQTATIAATQFQTPNNVAGGIEFDPFGTGTTVVTASIPNFLTLPAGGVTVTVSTPAVNMPVLQDMGGGLMFGAYQGTLGGSDHGGVQVHLVSSDPSRVLLGTTTTSTGAAEIDVPVVNGQTTFLFYVVGTDWVDGVSSTASVTVTGTASGFSSNSAPITYVRPALDIAGLVSTVSAASGNVHFDVRVGTPNATNTALRFLQWRRPGASPLVVTVRTATQRSPKSIRTAASTERRCRPPRLRRGSRARRSTRLEDSTSIHWASARRSSRRR